jgi:hypothetical protein
MRSTGCVASAARRFLRGAAAAGGRLQGEGHAQVGLIAAADRSGGPLGEQAKLLPHLLFVFEPGPRQPALAPDVGLLGDHRAVAGEMMLEPVHLFGEILQARVVGGRRRDAVRGLQRRGERAENVTELAGVGGRQDEAHESGGSGKGGETAHGTDPPVPV